jgi:hypothetical protein
VLVLIQVVLLLMMVVRWCWSCCGASAVYFSLLKPTACVNQ